MRASKKPRITKSERRVHLRYEQTHRILCSRVYPVAASNGSSVLLLGYDKGILLLWRGGCKPSTRPGTVTASLQMNDTATSQDMIVIGEDDGVYDHHSTVERQTISAGDTYNGEDDGQDSDTPYSPIICESALDLGSAVLRLATPSDNTYQAQSPARDRGVIVCTCSDGKVKVLTFSLEPPFQDGPRARGVPFEQVELSCENEVPPDIAVKMLANDEANELAERDHPQESLIVAAISESLQIWRLDIRSKDVIAPAELNVRAHTAAVGHVPFRGTKVSFHPSSRSQQLLVSDTSGTIRVYDCAESTGRSHRPGSRDSGHVGATEGEASGRWVMEFQVPFHSATERLGVPRRKRIIDAGWVLGGRGILTLLEDGEWGIWDVSGFSQSTKAVGEFVTHGHLGLSGAAEQADASRKRASASKLAPMTPNTRKAKAENLFKGGDTNIASRSSAVGGISAVSNNTRSGPVDECVLFWYGRDIYSIPSMQSFWQRSVNGGRSHNNLGTLYAPGLTRLTDFNTMNENITSISQFARSTTTRGLGQLNIQPDVLVSAEHRFLISQNMRPSTPAKSIFERASERTSSREHRLLSSNELDLGGVDRMLDSMAGEAVARRVGFAT